jgi:PKD repeat protein
VRGSYEGHIEIYSPAYLFNADGSPAARPTISGLSTTAVDLGATFQVFTPDAGSIASVVLVRPGAPTHAFDMDQRLVRMNFTAAAGTLNVVAPPNGNIAPPGFYMVFALNTAGVPSVASFIHLGSAPVNQPPTAAITSPATNATIAAGQPVLFSGNGTDPDGTIAGYSWSFLGGNPASSTLASAGNVTYSAPGTYVASLTVTDNGGLVSPAATRTITVPDFAISASPSSQSVLVGGTTSYAMTIGGGTGFSSTVALSVTGLPAGASASFTPASVSGSGSSTLNVAITTATPGGTYQLRITGTAGSIVHSTTVTLVVAGDFAITATPSLVTIARNGTAAYITTIVPGPGFSGTTSLSVTGLPKTGVAKFSSSSIVNGGSATLSVDTKKQVPRGTYPLKITGTSGATTHSVTVTLVVQ